MPFFIYILYSSTTDKFYIGYSEDPFRRLIEHNSGKNFKSTTPGRPWVIKAIFKVNGTRGEAVKIEKFIKQQKSRLLILKMIDPSFMPGGNLSQLIRVPEMQE